MVLYQFAGWFFSGMVCFLLWAMKQAYRGVLTPDSVLAGGIMLLFVAAYLLGQYWLARQVFTHLLAYGDRMNVEEYEALRDRSISRHYAIAFLIGSGAMAGMVVVVVPVIFYPLLFSLFMNVFFLVTAIDMRRRRRKILVIGTENRN